MPKSEQKQVINAIIVVGFIIVGVILLRGSKPPTLKNPSVKDTGAIVTNSNLALSAYHITGNPNAKLVIVEYSDLECPYCKAFHATMHRVVENSNGNVAWVFRHYPIPQLHPKAFHEAEATECAWEQGGDDAFWKYTDRVFEITPSNNGLDVAELPKIAQYIGLDVGSFETCLESGKFRAKIQQDIDDGIIDGVNGTPSSFILKNDKRVGAIPGAQPFEAVMQMLSAIK